MLLASCGRALIQLARVSLRFHAVNKRTEGRTVNRRSNQCYKSQHHQLHCSLSTESDFIFITTFQQLKVSMQHRSSWRLFPMLVQCRRTPIPTSSCHAKCTHIAVCETHRSSSASFQGTMNDHFLNFSCFSTFGWLHSCAITICRPGNRASGSDTCVAQKFENLLISSPL